MDLDNNTAYLVQIQDLWSNNTYMGIYKSLEAATKDVKEAYYYMEGIEDLEIKVYASTFGPCFDQEITEEDTGEYIRVSGYILRSDSADKFEVKYEDVVYD